MTYYHFIRVNTDGKPYLGYNDNRIVTVGETITVEGEPILCEHGLHASARIIDALEYCPEGDVALCRVELGGTIIRDTDKSVAQTRTIIAMLGAERTTTLLRDFARWCALQVIDLWDAPDVVRQYLETGDETLRASARDAAASAVAWSASAAASAHNAASAVAWSAAAWAAGAAADAAAWAAAKAAAAAAWAAGAAADAAAWAAAKAAAAAADTARAAAAAWAARAAAKAAAAKAAAAWAARAAQEAELQRLFHEAAEGGE
jgi:hypothetical protein